MPGLHEALEKTYDEIDSAGAGPPPQVGGPAPVPNTAGAPPSAAEPAPITPEPSGDRPRDESGRFVEVPKKVTPAGPGDRPVVTGLVPPATPIGTPALRPPQSWKLALREKFAALPPDVQQEVLRRDREVSIALQKAAQERDAATPIQKAIEPYERDIRAAGLEPARYVASLLQTVHALTYGPPQSKADLLAQVVMQYGADLLRPDQQDANGMQTSPLDRALAARLQGHPSAPIAQQPSPQQFRDPRLDQMMERWQAKLSAGSEKTVSAFAESHEFMNPDMVGTDVSNAIAEQMADLVDVWAKRGIDDISDEDLERAYNIACQMNPDVAPIFEQRKAAEAARKAQASTEQARLAASPVRSQPTAAGAAQPEGRRAVLEAAYDSLSRK